MPRSARFSPLAVPFVAALLLASLFVPGPAGRVRAGAAQEEALWSVLVPSDGSYRQVTLPAGTYLLTASGTYAYGGGAQGGPGAPRADASRSFHGDTVGECFDAPGDEHDLIVNSQSPWSGCSPEHVYSVEWVCERSCTLSFSIRDSYLGDNWGALSVSIRTLVRVASWDVAVSAWGIEAVAWVAPGTYSLSVKGTYQYAVGAVGALAPSADASRAMDVGAGLVCHDASGDVHDLLVNGVSPWVGCDPVQHQYGVSFSCVAVCKLSLRIKDDSYGDNSGSLSVSLRPA